MKTMLMTAALIMTGLAANAATIEVQIKGHKFVPAVVEVSAGDVVRWVNADGAPHTATGNGFDTGRLGKGDAGSIRFSAAGTYDYFCNIHRSMKGKIVVK